VGRAEDRAKRKALKQEKFAASKEALLKRVVNDQTPKTAEQPADYRVTRLAPHIERRLAEEEKQKQPKLGGSHRAGFIVSGRRAATRLPESRESSAGTARGYAARREGGESWPTQADQRPSQPEQRPAAKDALSPQIGARRPRG
jgi:hypothetical protein